MKGSFRSAFEGKIAKWLEDNGVEYDYEKLHLLYTVPESEHKYTPDWVFMGDKEVCYESKGFFPARDRIKLLHVRASNPDISLRIIFQDSTVKLNKNSKTSYGMWANKNGFDYFCWRTGDKKDFKKWIKRTC